MKELKLFREVNNLTQSDIAYYLGISKSFISQIEKGKVKMPSEKFNLLINNDKGWDTTLLINVNTTDNESSTSYDILEEDSSQAIIPIIPTEIAESPRTNIWSAAKTQKEQFEKLNMMYLVGDCDLVYRVVADVMSPNIAVGDLLFLQMVKGELQILNGEPYFLDTKPYGALVRYTYDEGDELRLIAPNRPYQELRIRKEDIYGIYIIKGKFSHRITYPDQNATKSLNKANKHISQLCDSVSSLIDMAKENNNRTDKLIEDSNKRADRLISLLESQLNK